MEDKKNRDGGFYSKLIAIAVPVVLQNFISSSLNMIDTVMIGKLGEQSIAAVGLSNQIFLLFVIILFGFFSGASIFTSQHWGKRDSKNIRRVLGLCLITGIFIAIIFTLVTLIFPKEIIGIFSKDIEVINLGAEYTFIIGFSYVFTAISFTYGSSARSVGQAKTAMLVTVVAVICNTLFNYMLIFGNFGMPALGVRGAAYATLIARIIDAVLFIFIIYRKDTPLAAKFSQLIDLSREFIMKVFKTAMPVMLNDFFWFLGMLVYYVAFARMGTEAIASFQIVNTIQNLFLIISIGLGNACAIMLGNEIGANNESRAIEYSKKFFAIGLVLSIILGCVLYSVAPVISGFFNVSEGVIKNVIIILRILSVFLWVNTVNKVTIIGVLRSGGDTKYALIIETACIWLIGVPLVLLGALYWKMPVYIVVLMANLEAVVKIIISIPRVISKKWVNNLVHQE